MDKQAEAVVHCAATLGESATWSICEAALYWVDIRAPALHRYDPRTGDHRCWPQADLCSAVVPTRDGVLLLHTNTLALFDPVTGQAIERGVVESPDLANRTNEAKCDRDGRLWVGTMRDYGAAISGSLYRMSGHGTATRVLPDITVPNGLGWSPDGLTMYFCDTADGAIRAYPYDRETGALGDMRIVSRSGDLPGRPDGCTVDARGNIWTTRFGAGEILRITPDGAVTARISLPVTQPTSCALGGPDFDTLFITTARQKLSTQQLREQPDAGHLFSCRVDVPGLPEPEWRYLAATPGS